MGGLLLVATVIVWVLGLWMSPHGEPVAAGTEHVRPVVVTFIRNGWGNKAPAVTAEQVAKLRKSTDPTSDRVIILKMR